MNTSEAVIEVTGVTKSFSGKIVVNNVDLTVYKGEIFGFLGPNGSGKTTFIRMLCGLLTPDAGKGHCLGYELGTNQRLIKLKVGYMTQRFSFYEDLTVKENLDFVARLYGIKNRQQAVEACMERFNFIPRQDQLAGNLSGGWKQRLALAACLMHQPLLLLLDEPTAGVDPKARRDFWEELHRLASEGMTILVTTHYMDEAERCHRLAYLSYGRKLAYGGIQQIIAEANLSTWLADGRAIYAIADEIKALPGVEQTVIFGHTVHISGRNMNVLARSLQPYAERYGLVAGQTSLEDVFIYLMEKKSQDNFGS